MAGRSEQAYRLFTPVMGPESTGLGSDEFEEADVWGCALELRPAEHHKPVAAATSRFERKKTEKRDRVTSASASASLPMNIPDWSKILRKECGGNNSYINSRRGLEDDDDDEGVGSGPVIPPHELLWRNRGASFSVHEGIGRTLKGRDLSRLRNAVWEKVGFQD